MAVLDTILKSLEATGCTFPETGLLQPADPFLDTTGEDLRRRIFLTQDNFGKKMCLRPEFTIPVCLEHLERGWIKARYAYGGKVFRQRSGDASEFVQAGFENLGSVDTNSADIDCILTAISALKSADQSNLSLVLGDQAIFVSLLDALQIPEAWKKRLIRAFGDEKLMRDHLETLSSPSQNAFEHLPAEVSAALESRVLSQVTETVKNEMMAQGLPTSGGRTAASIAERMIDKIELATARLDDEKRQKLETFLAIDVDLKDAADAIDDFENQYGLLLPMAREELATRFEGIQGTLDKIRYKASFGRRLDYYTGLVFEIYRQDEEKPLVGGGRYDRLMTLLGSPEEIPAVGFAIWVDRLEEAK